MSEKDKDLEKDINNSRRGFLGITFKTLPTVAIASMGITQLAQAIPEAPGSVNALSELPTDYMPSFFNDDEYKFIQSSVDLLIPQDDLGPGALLANVPEFIDRQMDTPYGYGQLWYMKGPFYPEIMKTTPTLGYQLNMNPRDVYRSGIKAFNDWCKKQHGENFADLPLPKQTEALQLLSDDKVDFPDDAVFANAFFSQLWNNTKEGFFADPMYAGNRDMSGWKMVGFPGARAAYLDWAGRYNEAYPLGPVSIVAKKR